MPDNRPVEAGLEAAVGGSVCVTGACGILGSRLVGRLAAAGVARIVAFDRVSGPRAPDADVEMVIGDLQDEGTLDRAIAGSDVVFHLAGLVDAGDSLQRPVAYFETNALGTARVMESCRRVDAGRVVYASTAHVYGVPRHVPARETDPTAPLSPYAASKLAGEIAVQGYVETYGVTADIMRFVNLYGSPYGAATVIGRALYSALEQGRIELRSFAPVRDFLYIDDAIDALLRIAAAASQPGTCRVINVGTGLGRSVGDMASAVADVVSECGFGRPPIVETDARAEERVPSLVVDTARLYAATGWRPATTLEHGLKQSLLEMTAGVKG